MDIFKLARPASKLDSMILEGLYDGGDPLLDGRLSLPQLRRKATKRYVATQQTNVSSTSIFWSCFNLMPFLNFVRGTF